MKSRIATIFFGFFMASVVNAGPPLRTIEMRGREEIVVTTPTIRLSDLAEVRSDLTSDDDIVIGLQKVFVANSPRAGESLTISAREVIDRLKSERINLDRIGYTFPRVMQVRRAAQELSLSTVRSALEQLLNTQSSQIRLRDVRARSAMAITPGIASIKARQGRTSESGTVEFDVDVSVDGQFENSFKVDATLEEWGEIPVAARSLAKGERIRDADLVRARLNISGIARDALRQPAEIVGLEARSDIRYGEAFRRGSLLIPPIISAGSRVTLSFRAGLLEATATGTALESKAKGEEIRVRNDASKRVVVGVAVSEGLVRVAP